FEFNDNVIPASNSVMAKNLFLLGHYFNHQHFKTIAQNMVKGASKHFMAYPSGYSNWAMLLLWNAQPFYEVAVTGMNSKNFQAELQKNYLPTSLFMASERESQLPLLQHKWVENKTLIYVCVNQTCQKPFENPLEVLPLIK